MIQSLGVFPMADSAPMPLVSLLSESDDPRRPQARLNT